MRDLVLFLLSVAAIEQAALAEQYIPYPVLPAAKPQTDPEPASSAQRSSRPAAQKPSTSAPAANQAAGSGIFRSSSEAASKPAATAAADTGGVTFKGQPIDGELKDSSDFKDYADKILAYAPSSTAVDAVNKVVSYTGLTQNFVIQPAAVSNVVAVFDGQKRMILYNPDFLGLVENSIDHDWGVLGILAHEVGHHLQGHTLAHSNDAHRNELEADHFSGYIMFRMGASLDDALATMRSIGVEVETPSHPPKSERLAAITNGWNDARQLSMSTSAPAKSLLAAGDKPARQTLYQDAANSPDALSYTGRFVLARDSSTIYFITRGNDLLWRDKAGAFHIVGKKRAPRTPQYAWTLETSYVIFDVGFDGMVTSVFPSGQAVQVGYVMAP